MATEFTPDDAVRAIQAMPRVLETLAGHLTQITDRMERSARWQCWLLALVLLSSVGMFVVGAWTHGVQNEALRHVMQENRAIFERLNR